MGGVISGISQNLTQAVDTGVLPAHMLDALTQAFNNGDTDGFKSQLQSVLDHLQETAPVADPEPLVSVAVDQAHAAADAAPIEAHPTDDATSAALTAAAVAAQSMSHSGDSTVGALAMADEEMQQMVSRMSDLLHQHLDASPPAEEIAHVERAGSEVVASIAAADASHAVTASTDDASQAWFTTPHADAHPDADHLSDPGSSPPDSGHASDAAAPAHGSAADPGADGS